MKEIEERSSCRKYNGCIKITFYLCLFFGDGMQMPVYRGVNGTAREIISQYRGIGGVAREIVKEYRGVSGVAREVYSKNELDLDEIDYIKIKADYIAGLIYKYDDKTYIYSGISNATKYGTYVATDNTITVRCTKVRDDAEVKYYGIRIYAEAYVVSTQGEEISFPQVYANYDSVFVFNISSIADASSSYIVNKAFGTSIISTTGINVTGSDVSNPIHIQASYAMGANQSRSAGMIFNYCNITDSSGNTRQVSVVVEDALPS